MMGDNDYIKDRTKERLGNRDSKERPEGAEGQHHRDLQEQKEGKRRDGREEMGERCRQMLGSR